MRWSGAPSKLVEAIEYSLFAGGKRLRPSLVMECYRACRIDAAIGPGSKEPGFTSASAAAAIELVHTFSLTPPTTYPPWTMTICVAGSRPTIRSLAKRWRFWPVMQCWRWRLRFSRPMWTFTVPKIGGRAIPPQAGQAGMIGGQVLDIAAEHQSLDLAQLQQIHSLKTEQCSPPLPAWGRFAQGPMICHWSGNRIRPTSGSGVSDRG